MTEPSQIAPGVPAREVRRRFILFLLPGVLQLGLVFLTLPLTTLVLGPADFALFSLTISFSALVTSLSQMGSIYLLAQRFRSATDDERRRLVTTLASLVLTASSVLASLMVVGFILVHDSWGVAAGISVTMVLLAAFECIGAGMHALAGSVSVYGYAPGYYALVTILKVTIATAAVLLGLFVFDLHVMALFVGHAAGGGIALIGSLLMLSRMFMPTIDWNIMKESLQLGGWSTVAYLALQGRQTIERALLSSYTGFHNLGIYTHAQQYQSLAMLACRPVQSAVSPVMLDEAAEAHRAFLRTARTMNAMFLGVTVLGVILGLFGRDLIGLVTHDKFSDAAPYAALLTGVVLVQFSGRPQFARLLANGRGRYLSMCNVLAVGGALLGLIALLPFLGLPAAVCASYVQFLVYRLLTEVGADRFQRLPFQDRQAILGVLMIGSTVTLVQWFDPDLWTRGFIMGGIAVVMLIFGRQIVADVLYQFKDQVAPSKRITSNVGRNQRVSGS